MKGWWENLCKSLCLSCIGLGSRCLLVGTKYEDDRLVTVTKPVSFSVEGQG